jgi:uncharacterized protein YunC (DUF1805 family)
MTVVRYGWNNVALVLIQLHRYYAACVYLDVSIRMQKLTIGLFFVCGICKIRVFFR